MSDYYKYKSQTYSCQFCSWQGLGAETLEGEMFNDGFEIICPECKSVNHESPTTIDNWKPSYLDFIMYPRCKEVMEFGEEHDKEIVEIILKLSKETDQD